MPQYKYGFIIIENERLKFKNSEELVKDFIQKRLQHYGVESIVYTSRTHLDDAIRERTFCCDIIVIQDIMNPIIDFQLVTESASVMMKNEMPAIRIDGAVPGTQFEYMCAYPYWNIVEDIAVYRVHTQDHYNNQFNLYKYKRLHQFVKLIEKIPDIYGMDIDDIMKSLKDLEVFHMLAGLGTEAKQGEYEKCPCCAGDLMPLPMRMSQPFCGYIPSDRPVYYQCVKCGIVVLSPFIQGDESYKMYDEYDTQDFVVSTNNPYKIGTTRCDVIEDLAGGMPAKSITLDLGGGIGHFSRFVKERHPDWKVTHSDLEAKQFPKLEKEGICTRTLNFMKEEIGTDEFDLITAWEVIEHMPIEVVDDVVTRIWNALKPGGYFAFSTPDMDSPLCQMNDFFAICPPFHYTVFGKKWINNYFEREGWEMVTCRACSDFLDDSDMWCDYASKTAPSFQLRATAKVLKLLLGKEENRKMLLEEGIGTELVCVVRKCR